MRKTKLSKGVTGLVAEPPSIAQGKSAQQLAPPALLSKPLGNPTPIRANRGNKRETRLRPANHPQCRIHKPPHRSNARTLALSGAAAGTRVARLAQGFQPGFDSQASTARERIEFTKTQPRAIVDQANAVGKVSFIPFNSHHLAARRRPGPDCCR